MKRRRVLTPLRPRRDQSKGRRQAGQRDGELGRGEEDGDDPQTESHPQEDDASGQHQAILKESQQIGEAEPLEALQYGEREMNPGTEDGGRRPAGNDPGSGLPQFRTDVEEPLG